MIISGKYLFLNLVIALIYQKSECGFAPPLPTNRRTQYYYIYEDGGYKHGYDTGEGAYSKGIATPDNEVQGDYAYQGPDGKIDVKYTAGKAGFIPDGYTPPQSAPSVYHGHGDAAHVDHHLTGQYNPAEDELPGDASYTFSYDVGDQSRQEVSDTLGNIEGSYSYVSKDGSTKKVEYEAGAEKGFLIKGISPSAGRSGYTGQEAGFSNPDGSYSFSYVAGDHSRHESADANGNIFGSFSFIAKDDGLNREVNYNAGAEKGFIPSGSHLPEPVQPIIATGTAPESGHGVEIARIHGEHAGLGSTGTHSKTHGTTHAATHHSAPVTTYSTASHSTSHSRIGITDPGRAYEFSYNAGDHSRHESADANGNVVGSFTFIAKDDGINRKLDYEAGAEKGFLAFGSHLPTAPSEHPAGQTYHATNAVQPHSAVYHETQSHSKVAQPHFHSAAAHHGVATSYIAPKTGASTATAGSTSHFSGVSGSTIKSHHSSVSPYSAIHDSSTNPQGDGSYSFSYDAGDHTRQESSDSAGNVVGSFSFVAKDDGLQRKVNYEAGPQKGFTASGEHLPLQPSAIAPFIAAAKHGHDYVSKDYDSYGNAVGHKQDYDNDYYDENSDRSYTFSYNAGDHTRTETADSVGNVVGSFSFVAKDDGLNRKLDYEAGAEKGFIAKGNHLPIPPSSDGTAFAPAQHAVAHHAAVHHAAAHHAAVHHAAAHHAAAHHAVPQHIASHHAVAHHAATASAAAVHSGHVDGGSAGIGEATYLDNKAFFKSFLTPNSHHKFGYIYDTSK